MSFLGTSTHTHPSTDAPPLVARLRSGAKSRGVVLVTVLVAGVASAGSLDMGDPIVTSTGYGSPQTVTLDPGTEPRPTRIHVASNENSGTAELHVAITAAWDGGSSSSSSSGVTEDFPVIAATLTALDPTAEKPEETGDRALTMAGSSGALEVSLESACPGKTCDFDLTLRRVELHPSGEVLIHWTPTADVPSTDTAVVTVTVMP